MCTLFVVDDDVIFQGILKMSFKHHPAFKHVHYFSNGEEFLTYLAEHKRDPANLPDVIFLDLDIPLAGGWVVLDTMKRQYPSFVKAVAVYIVTASIMAHEKEHAQQYGFVREFISKPLFKEKILAIANDNAVAKQ